MDCPRCGLINRSTALRCDCGYDFASGRAKAIGQYISGHKYAQWVVALLGLSVLIDFVALVSGYSQASLISDLSAGQKLSEADIEANDSRQQIIGVIQILLFVPTVVAFLCWLRRAYGNLPAIGVITRFTSNWAVGWFFVPFMNIFRPYQVVKELWIGSQAGNSSLVGWWWAFYLLMSFLSTRSFALMNKAKTTQDYLTATWVSFAADALSVVAAILAIAVVRAIDSGQERLAGTVISQPHEGIALHRSR